MLFEIPPNLRCKLEPHLQRVEDALKHHLPFSSDRQLAEVMEYALFPPGKRLRPVLVYLSADLCANRGSSVDPIACGVEFLHAASLLLDDLPCMDDASVRRGKSAAHVVFGQHLSVLAAHSFVSLCFQTVADSGLPDDRVRRIISRIARTVGGEGMTLGQLQGLRGHSRSSLLDPMQVAEKTGGLLFAASSYCGAVAAGAPPELCLKMHEFGLLFGRVFQCLDDMTDAWDEDHPDRSSNAVHLLGENRVRDALKSEVQRAMEILRELGGEDVLEELLVSMGRFAEQSFTLSRTCDN